jgi:DNA helicase HerA-like ATPase
MAKRKTAAPAKKSLPVDAFLKSINEGYQHKGDALYLGCGMLEDEKIAKARIEIPLKTLNRHGLIAGATGTGKTKTLQVMAEGLAEQGIPVLLMDMKGDLSGLAMPGAENPHITERHATLGEPWQAGAVETEFLSISDEPGVKMRATVSEFGPVLFSRILGLNENQGATVAIIFKFCDDNALPLLDLKDFRAAIQYMLDHGKGEIEEKYGALHTATASLILRKIVQLESQGAERFFGEISFEVKDLLRLKSGRGRVNIMRLIDIQDRPRMFSTFMLGLLAEIYEKFPEVGDKPKPKLVLFIDEAHLIFDEATAELLERLEAIIKLIRSKGVGIFFCTQSPADIPEAILGQLGLKVQHALRAFTAKDRKAIKLAAENYPESEFYDVAETLTQMGIGEAFITALNEKGIPTPLARTYLRAPVSRMDPLTAAELSQNIKASELADQYNRAVDRESAYEILSAKLKEAAGEKVKKPEPVYAEEGTQKSRKKEKSIIEKVSENTMARQIGRTVAREVTRGILGAIGLKGGRRKKGWFF